MGRGLRLGPSDHGLWPAPNDWPKHWWIREGIRERERDPETLFGMCLHPASQSDLSLLLHAAALFLYSLHVSQCVKYILKLQQGSGMTSHFLSAMNAITSKELLYIHYL